MKKITAQIRNFFSSLTSVEEKESVPTMESLGVREKFKSLDPFIFLWKNCMKKMAVRTDVDITFSRYFTFGSDMAYIRKFVGKPVYSMCNAEMNINILLYAVVIKGHNVNFELHFHDRKLFCINYTYNYLTSRDRREILNSLEEKYHVSSAQLHNHIIVDKAGNGILVEENETLTINYLAPNSNVKYLTESYSGHSRIAM